jgi:thioredoxin 2
MTDPAIVSCPNCGKRNRVPAVAAGTPRCAVCATPLPWLVRTGEDDFDAIVRSALPVLVDFWAPWCRPCDIVAPGVEQAAERLAGRLKVVKVDIDRAQDVGGRYGVRSIPSLLVLSDGKEVARQVGAVPPPRLLQWVEQVIQQDNQPAPSA